MAKERECIFCGKKYEYCPHCSDTNKYPEWMFNFCSEKCHDIYDAVAGFNMGIKTVDDIKKVLKKYSVEDYSIFSKRLQDILNEGTIKKENDIEIRKNNSVSRKKKHNFERRDSIEE